MPDRPTRAFVFAIPTLEVSGGILEIVKLARQLSDRGHPVRIVALWRTDHAIDTGLPTECLSPAPFSKWAALRGMSGMLVAFARRMRAWRVERPHIVFTHYSTYPLATLTPRSRRWFFVQGIEWNFGSSQAYRAIVKRFILFNLRRGRVLTTNAYLSQALHDEHVLVAARVPIWIDPRFVGRLDQIRDLDLVLVLRHGGQKRADLGLEVVDRCRASYPALRVAIITPDNIFADMVRDKVALCLLRPDLEQMRDIYARTRVFLLLSEHEGFGLPPLEAMASGCVPVCRAAGGVSTYMTGELGALVLPLDRTMGEILDTVTALLADPARLSRLSALSSDVARQGLIELDQRLDRPAARAFVQG